MRKGGRYGQFIRLIFTIIDFIILNVTYLILSFILGYGDTFYSKESWLLLNISYLISGYFFSSIHENRVVYADKVLLKSIQFTIVNIIIYLSMHSFMSDNDINIKALCEFFLVLLIATSTWWIVSRKILKLYRKSGYNFKRIIIIGNGDTGKGILQELQSDSGYGYTIMGLFDINQKSYNKDGIYYGDINELNDFVKSKRIDEMYCALPGVQDNTMYQMIKIAEGNAIDFYYVPQVNLKIKRRYELHSISNVPILSLRPNPLNIGLNKVVKRFFDIITSSIVLLISPIIIIPVAIAIKVSSPGPILFKQKRTGYRGKEFTCYKFRSMRLNSNSDTQQASKDDPRKTRVGEFLRRSSIDELPQFYNVWRGDMSIVGPRPHMVKHTEDYSKLIDQYMLRHVIKPGITGWAQVCGYRGETKELWQMERRIEYDVWYTEHWNLLLDLKIIFLTVINAIRGEKNAF